MLFSSEISCVISVKNAAQKPAGGRGNNSHGRQLFHWVFLTTDFFTLCVCFHTSRKRSIELIQN